MTTAVLAAGIALAPVAAVAAAPSELLGEAFTAYQQAQQAEARDERIARFRSAERLFAAAAAQAVAPNADLLANAGTAALQAERLGPAVLAFRRALELDPDHARANQNLEHARTLLPPWVPRPDDTGVLDSFFFWHRSQSRAERAGAGAAAFFVMALLIATSIAGNGTVGRLARSLAVVPALVWIALALSVAADAMQQAGVAAVVVADEAVARAADSTNAPARFASALPGGAEVTITEDRGRWLRLTLANGRDAWVTSGSVEAVAPSLMQASPNQQPLEERR